jgi:Zn-dependent peptidase ImmA (M78 family)/transcriptional regulator with XRE-family HTH domain
LSPFFNPTRLRVARKRKGMTKTALAAAIDVSVRSVTAYEAGDQQPSTVTVARLVHELGFSDEFYYGADVDELNVGATSFRALCKMTQKQRDQAIAAAELALVLNDWIEQQFALPSPDVSRYPGVTPETAAEMVRLDWGIGESPVRNMTHLLEKHGVRVFSLAEESRNVDGFSFWRSTSHTPFVFLDTTKSSERARMDAAHELGHLVLHAAHDCDRREAENEAKAFGSAFLMPERSVLANTPRNATVNDILRLKRQWNVSAAALAFRMHKIGLLTRWEYQTLFKQMNVRGLLTAEADSMEHETSQVLDKVFRALRADGITKAEVARRTSIPLEELNRLVFGLVLSRIEGGGDSADAVEAEKIAEERRKTFRLA